MATPSPGTPRDVTSDHAPRRSPRTPAGPTERAADLGGRALSVLINRVYGRGRPRPLHPRGESRRAVWAVDGARAEPTGVPILDQAGAWTCVVRHSRAVGLPGGWPDIEGMAVHIEGEDGGDVLLAGTGDGRVGRHLLVPRWSSGTCTTLLPLRTPTGPVLLRLRPPRSAGDSGEGAASDGQVWEVSWSRPGRGWHLVGMLTMRDEAVSTPHFDPVEHPPRGLEHYPTVALLRSPSYRQARRQSGETHA